MVDKKKILLHSAEMAEHANGAAQYLDRCKMHRTDTIGL